MEEGERRLDTSRMIGQFINTILVITPDGIQFPLWRDLSYQVTGIGGRGFPGVTFSTTRGFNQDQSIVEGWSVEPRLITIQIFGNPPSNDEYWLSRGQLLDYLRWNQGGPLVLRFTREDGKIFDINVFSQNTPGFESESLDIIDETLQFIAYDPFFYGEEVSEDFVVTSYQSNLILPFTLPFVLGSASDEAQLLIPYEGTWPTWPTLTIRGPHTGLTLMNTSSLVGLHFYVPLLPGESRVVTTNPGEIGIVDGSGISTVNELVIPPSNLVAFNLRPRGVAWKNAPYDGVPDGINDLRAYYFGGDATTRFTATWRPRYIGIGE